jgi:DNA polymerase alpha subunit A
LGVSLDVLLHRMRDLKVDHWSRIGRFRRSRWPSIGKQGSNLKFINGRMLCDLASDGAKVWHVSFSCIRAFIMLSIGHDNVNHLVDD